MRATILLILTLPLLACPPATGSGDDDDSAAEPTPEPTPEIREPAPAGGLKETVRGAVVTLEREIISRALREHRGNVTHTAEALGLSRKGLQLKMKEYGIRREDVLR